MLLSIYFCHVSNSVQKDSHLWKNPCVPTGMGAVFLPDKSIFSSVLSNTMVFVNLFSANSGGAQLAIESNKSTPENCYAKCRGKRVI